MDKGLDELIDWLLTEIAFSGLEGYAAVNLIKAVKDFYKDSSHTNQTAETPGNQQNNAVDIQHASVVWKWLVNRRDVSVGHERRYNRLSLEEVLAIPEDGVSSTNPTSSGQVENSNSRDKYRGSATGRPRDRPRLHLTEERQWKAIAGHAPDLKRLPTFEWQALVAIASTKGDGILQGDLVRLTGQDKRSLPQRTYALAEKGYVIKRPWTVRGSLTSKLWLSQFANCVKEQTENQGLPLDKLDLSTETLTQNGLDPVSFRHYYTGDKIEYLALGQAFMAIVKAFGIMRYCDIRVKMGVTELTRHMRALAKASRWLASNGVILFTPGVFPGSSKVFKDCVKFLREPTPEEWKKFQVTPKGRVPGSTRRGAKGKVVKSQAPLTKTKTAKEKGSRKALLRTLPSPDMIRLAQWTPYKPMVNTIYEIIKRGGAEGASNAEIQMLTAGYPYRKWIASMNTAMSSRSNSQDFPVTSEMKRVGRTSMYYFFADLSGRSLQKTIAQEAYENQEQGQEGLGQEQPEKTLENPISSYFSAAPANKLVRSGVTSLSQIVQGTWSTGRPISMTRAGLSNKGTLQRRGRPRKQVVVDETSEVSTSPQNSESPFPKRRIRGRTSKQYATEKSLENTGELPQSPGDEVPTQRRKTRVRPRKSYVIDDESADEMEQSVNEVVSHPMTVEPSTEARQNRGSPQEQPAFEKTSPSIEERSTTQHSQYSGSAPRRRGRPRKHHRDEDSAIELSHQSQAPKRIKREQSPPSDTEEGPLWDARGNISLAAYRESKMNRIAVFTSGEQLLMGENRKLNIESYSRGLPGVFYGQPNSTGPRTFGRKKASLVMIFRSPSLKTAGSHTAASGAPGANSLGNNAVNGSKIDAASEVTQDVTNERGLEEHPVCEQQKTKTRTGRKPAAGGPSGFKCDKCGGSWKNTNGLEYHQQKSKTPCNPDYAPAPLVFSKPISRPKPKPVVKERAATSKRKVPETESDASDAMRGPNSPVPKPEEAVVPQTPKPKMELPSKRPKLSARLSIPMVPNSPKQPGSHGSSITLHSVQLRNVPDLSASIQNRAGPTDRQNLSESRKSMRQSVSSDTNMAAEKMTAPQPSQQEAGRVKISEAGEAAGISLIPSQKMNQALKPSASDTERVLDLRAPNKRASIAADKKTASTQRRERVADIIRHLLERNSGAFPGDRSLYVVIASIWAKTFDDMGPPDYHTFNVVLNKMEQAGVIKREHFGFFGGKGQTKLCTVISKVLPQTAADDIAELTEVIEGVKDKIKELHPSPYIPAGFSVSPDELDLFGAVASRTKTATVTAPPKTTETTKQTEAQEIPVMSYRLSRNRDDKSVTVDNQTVSKSQKQDHAQTIDSDTSITPVPRKRRRRVVVRPFESSDYWVNGKVATFLWRQKRNGNEWQQKLPCLQDPTTSAWSWIPCDTGATTIDTILSTVKDCRAIVAGGKRYRQRRNQDDEIANTEIGDHSWRYDRLMPEVERAMKASASVQILKPSTSASFVKENGDSDDDDDEDEDLDQNDILQTDLSEKTPTTDDEGGIRFGPIREILAIDSGVWPNKFPRAFFHERDMMGSFTMVGYFPDLRWFLRQNLPQNAEEMVENCNRKIWVDPSYGPHRKFIKDIVAIEAWELSPEGVYLQHRGSIAPEHIFISISIESSMLKVESVAVEWPSDTQYTPQCVPEDILDVSSEDEETGDSETSAAEELPRKRGRASEGKKMPARPFPRISRAVEFKTRSFAKVPPQPRGRRWNRHKADEFGPEREKEIIAGFVVVRLLTGGVDRQIDWNLILKLYPQFSHSGMRKYWTKVSKERKSFILALSKKFQSEFLEAYERGDIPVINYDDLENYDWKAIIQWACKLETHERIHLPRTRDQLEKRYLLEDGTNRPDDWRDTWFHTQSSVFTRIEASASELMAVIPPHPSDKDGRLARSWIRSLCNNSVRDTVGYEIRDILMKSSKLDERSLNALLERTVQQLMDEKIVTKVRGKGLGQLFRLNNVFQKRTEKLSQVEKFGQAARFKSKLDESFRHNEGVILPYDADAGSIMALLSMNAYGRVFLEKVNYPHAPHGFEPSNYEGRLFPKSYYHFGMKLVPTERYIYNKDMPLVNVVKGAPIPAKNTDGEIPIWRDFFGNPDADRWIQYLCAVSFTISIKGPLSLKSATVHLRPMVEEFEVELIVQWLDRLGLLETTTGDHGWTTGEWWWLAVGTLVDIRAKGFERAPGNTSA